MCFTWSPDIIFSAKQGPCCLKYLTEYTEVDINKYREREREFYVSNYCPRGQRMFYNVFNFWITSKGTQEHQ